MALYIASDHQLPLIDWDENKPDFYVKELGGQYDEKVKSQFTKPHIYYVGAHTGCGCGFEYGRYPNNENDEEKSRQSVNQLSDYLGVVTAKFGEIELFACWEGDQAKEPEHRGEITAKEIGGKSFWFEEKQFLIIKPSNK
jgi:hypothetical protein